MLALSGLWFIIVFCRVNAISKCHFYLLKLNNKIIMSLHYHLHAHKQLIFSLYQSIKFKESGSEIEWMVHSTALYGITTGSYLKQHIKLLFSHVLSCLFQGKSVILHPNHFINQIIGREKLLAASFLRRHYVFLEY